MSSLDFVSDPVNHYVTLAAIVGDNGEIHEPIGRYLNDHGEGYVMSRPDHWITDRMSWVIACYADAKDKSG